MVDPGLQDSLIEDLMPTLAVLEEIQELPCAECGGTGDTLPCIACDKLVCGQCGTGIRFCKTCGDPDE